jgi:hypothetical protein
LRKTTVSKIYLAVFFGQREIKPPSGGFFNA